MPGNSALAPHPLVLITLAKARWIGLLVEHHRYSSMRNAPLGIDLFSDR